MAKLEANENSAAPTAKICSVRIIEFLRFLTAGAMVLAFSDTELFLRWRRARLPPLRHGCIVTGTS